MGHGISSTALADDARCSRAARRNPAGLQARNRPPTLPTTIEALLKSIKPTTWHGSKVSGIDLGSDFVWIDDQPLRVEIDELQGRKLLSRLIIIDTNKDDDGLLRAIDAINSLSKTSSHNSAPDPRKDLRCEEQRGHLNFPNGAIDWTNASEHSDLLTGKVPGGSIDPDFTRVGSCSREGAETEVLQKDPWCQRDYRDFTLITLDAPTSRPTALAKSSSPTFYDCVIRPLVDLDVSRNKKSNL